MKIALLAAALLGLAATPTPVQVCDGLKFPEGPAYDGQGHVVLSNCQADYITRVSLDGKVEAQWLTASKEGQPFTFVNTNGMTYYRDGSLFICDQGRKAIVRVTPDRKGEVYAESCDGAPFKGPNDLAFDAKGNLYFTDPVGSGRRNPVGCVYLVEAGSRRVRKVAEGMAFPNGLALSADGKSLYVNESQYNRVVRFPVQPDGTLGKIEPFADLSPDGPDEPDGMAVDAKGRLWIAHFGARTVLVVDGSGKIVDTIRFPKGNGMGPTNLEFAGRDMKTLYVTDPGVEALWKMRTDTPGLALFSAPKNR